MPRNREGNYGYFIGRFSHLRYQHIPLSLLLGQTPVHSFGKYLPFFWCQDIFIHKPSGFEPLRWFM
jgi:hypothetical protein